MASWGRADFEAFREMQEKLQRLQNFDMESFALNAVKRLQQGF